MLPVMLVTRYWKNMQLVFIFITPLAVNSFFFIYFLAMLDGIWASLPSPPEKDSISRVIREPSSSFPHTGWTNYISQERKITGYYLHGPAQYELQDCLCQQLGQCKPVWNKMKHRGPRNMCWNMSCHVIDCLKLRLRVEEHWKRGLIW